VTNPQYDYEVYLCRFLGAPDLNGTYTGYILSSFDKHGTKHVATLKIRQTWSEMSIVMTTENSTGHSLSASMMTEIGTLTYEYLNEPKPNAVPQMHVHRGTGRFNLNSDNGLEGEYYSGRDRQNYGTMNFARVTDKPIVK
jgi:hypothetical protein